MDATEPAAQPIALPANFPVDWETPGDALLTWVFDRMHWPAQLTPMVGSYIDIFLESADPVMKAFEQPARMRSCLFNTYHYHALAPLPLACDDPSEQQARGAARIDAALRSLADQWAHHDLPAIKQCLAFWEQFDLQSASLSALLVHLDETLARVRQLSEIHHRVQILAALAPSLFQDYYRDLFGGEADANTEAEGELAAYRLLQGFDNKTLEAGRALWRLSRTALASPPVRAAIQGHAASDVLSALEREPEYASFLADLRSYLRAYGQRSASVLDLAAPTWLDDPTPVIHDLQRYMAQEHDLEREFAAQVDERERAVAEANRRLHTYPQTVVNQFGVLLAAAQAGVFLSEEHNHWIDYCMTHAFRRVMLEFGRRFAAGHALECPRDIFLLTIDDVRTTAEGMSLLDRRQLAAARRAELDHFRAIEPPPMLGAFPTGPSPDDPLSRSEARFWGAPPAPSADPRILRGQAGSPGMVRGRARVVRSLAEAGKLEPGDVLVAASTMPAWTPLFLTAAAVVTDTGGVLSHSAIVAREYGIPAVVGTGVATSTIRDGQLVEVEGGAGIVRIL
jgi:pyruvate,water dikinase